MKRIKIDIAYDGTTFAGWQIQPNHKSVQGEIQKQLSEIIGSEIKITGSGRTDSGVHARGQVAHFDVDKDSMEPSRFTAALNSLLCKDIRILSAEYVNDNFHSRFSATKRTYQYYIIEKNNYDLFNRNYCYTLKKSVNFKLLNQYAASIIGEHDFTSFAAVKDASNSKIRFIYNSVFYYQDNRLIYQITGNAFLWKMVRSLIGTMLELESKKAEPAEMLYILQSKKRELAGTTAPAKGLFLEKVEYGTI